jgi:hypothetical protein
VPFPRDREPSPAASQPEAAPASSGTNAAPSRSALVAARGPASTAPGPWRSRRSNFGSPPQEFWRVNAAARLSNDGSRSSSVARSRPDRLRSRSSSPPARRAPSPPPMARSGHTPAPRPARPSPAPLPAQPSHSYGLRARDPPPSSASGPPERRRVDSREWGSGIRPASSARASPSPSAYDWGSGVSRQPRLSPPPPRNAGGREGW